MNKILTKTFIIISALFLMNHVIIAQSKKTIYVEKIDKTKLEKLIKNRKGKVLFLNVWASWCGPCKREFPDIVKLAEKYKNSKVEIVGLSVDDLEDLQTDVIPFLEKNNVNFKIYISNFQKVEDLITFLNKDWRGNIPTTFIYDSKGNQKKFIVGMRDFNTFDKEIQEVLNSSK